MIERATYYIDGWEEKSTRFFNLGKFTRKEIDEMKNGKVIKRAGHEFRIEVE